MAAAFSNILDDGRRQREILGRIVDVMLDAQDALHRASVDEWREILVERCRNERDRGQVLTTCSG
jgi:hypothetical protein